MSESTLFTIGHSNRQMKEFIELLQLHCISAIADVRSQPYSRHLPQFNREQLNDALRERYIAYVFLGDELGARRKERDCYVDGKARYELIAQTPLFQAGLERIRTGLKTHRIALMCAEKDPVTCHRTILISRQLRNEFPIQHVVSPVETVSQDDVEQRLLLMWRLSDADLFRRKRELVDEAYSKQAEQIAYVEKAQKDVFGG